MPDLKIKVMSALLGSNDQICERMESSVLPLEFNRNTDRCIIQSAMLQSVQSNVSEVVDASASRVSIHECFRIVGEKIVIQQAHEKKIALSRSLIMSTRNIYPHYWNQELFSKFIFHC